VKFERKFTGDGKGPYNGIEWVARTSEIRNPDGKPVFYMEGVVVPSFWSQIATDIIAQKYFRKAGVSVDKAGAWTSFVPAAQRQLWKPSKDGGETDARQVFHRLAYTWVDWGRKAGYFDAQEDERAFYDETLYMLAHQVAAPNSPQYALRNPSHSPMSSPKLGRDSRAPAMVAIIVVPVKSTGPYPR